MEQINKMENNNIKTTNEQNFLKEIELGIFCEEKEKEIYIKAFKRLKEIAEVGISNLNFNNYMIFKKIKENKFLTIVKWYGDFKLEFKDEDELTTNNIKNDLDEGIILDNTIYPIMKNYDEILNLKSYENKIKLNASSIEDYKEKLINHLKQESNNDDYYIENGFLNLFFDKEDYNFKEEIDYGLRKILKVLEFGNLRVALIGEREKNYSIIYSNEKTDFYNYLDKNRYFFIDSYRNEGFHFFDLNINIKEINEFLEQKNNINDRDIPIIIYQENIMDLIGKERLKEQLEQKKEEEYEDLRNKTIKELNRGHIISNGIKIKNGGIVEYQNQKIGHNGFKIRNYIEYNFTEFKNTDFNNIFNYIINDIDINQDLNNLWLGSFKVDIEVRKSKANADLKYINGIRINHNEVRDTLKRGICFNKKEDYINLLKEISKCSIKIHNALSDGIIIQMKSCFNDNYHEKFPVKIQIERKANKHYLILDNKEIGIKNINALLDLTNQNYNYDRTFERLREILLKNTYIIDDKDILNLIKNGLTEYKEALRRSEELLQDTIKKLDVKIAKIEIEDIETQGYIVKGKISEYFITDSLKIYKYPSLKYVCIIDKDRIDIVGKDKLISRLYALSNDSLMTSNIYTLNK